MTNTELREKLVELLVRTPCVVLSSRTAAEHIADHLIANGVTVNNCARALEEWHEDYGDVLWWKFPIEEPPYVGSPWDASWPDYHTHWTPIAVPDLPKEEENDRP